MALGWLRRWVGGEWTERPALAGYAADCADERRLRLAGCAIFHAVTPLMRLGRWHDAIGIGERLADGTETEADRRETQRFTAWACNRWMGRTPRDDAFVGLITDTFSFQSLVRVVTTMERQADSSFAYSTLAVITAAVRDVFGDPYDPVPFDPAWRTPDAVGVARAVYDGRAFGDLPVLADALQEAGCADDRVLGHCRGGGAHFRGCWVVDAVLDKLVSDGPPHVPRTRRA